MKKPTQLLVFIWLISFNVISSAENDTRQLVKMPKMMQNHMKSNMRNHLVALNEILVSLSNKEMDKAADIAEHRLGMSSLTSHGADHMGKFMPEGMQNAGTQMHKSASRFALKAQEGELQPAYKSLSEVTAACIACHSAYRIQ